MEVQFRERLSELVKQHKTDNDIYHDLSEPLQVLAELRRVLKPDGILSSHDHHLAFDVRRAGLLF